MKHAAIAVFFLLAAMPAAGGAAAADHSYNDLWRQTADRLAAGRLAAADSLVERILARARQEGDADHWARALIERSSLRSALSAPETAARELRATPWPDGARERAVLELHDARALTAYYRRYAYEIRSRENVAGADSLDLKNWGPDRIAAEIDAALHRAWSGRGDWGGTGLDAWRAYIAPNDYPAGIRGTLRDAVTYMRAEHLADSAFWGPTVANRTMQLGIEELLTAPLVAAAAATAALADSTTLPLLKVGFLMADLRTWHLEHGRPGAALEAVLAHLRSVWRARSRQDDRVRTRQFLETVLADVDPAEPWWSEGQAQLAEFLQQERDPDSLVRAHLAAARGARRHPGTVGGERCAWIQAELEAPRWRLNAMAVDAPGRRSIGITHRNLERLYLRAWRYDKATHWYRSRARPDGKETAAMIADRAPDLRWSVDLPATPDYRDHRTWTGLPPCGPGAYLVIASTGPEFAAEQDDLQAVDILVSDLVATVQGAVGGTEILVRRGADGLPVAGAEVTVGERDDWRSPDVLVRLRTDAEGRVWRPGPGRRHSRALITHGEHTAVLQNVGAEVESDEAPRLHTFLYTDRAVYRPGQTVHWKVVAYASREARTVVVAVPDFALEIALKDANGQQVASTTVTTNSFGSASGTFQLPESGLLGGWRIEDGQRGAAFIRVEQYKRPTFEVALLAPEVPLRPGRPAAIPGKAAYFHGQPVTAARITWQVTRDVQTWRGWGVFGPAAGDVVASGTAVPDGDGRFSIAFMPEPVDAASPEAVRIATYQVTAKVTDAGGETRSAQRWFNLGTTAVVASLERPSGFLAAGRPDSLTVLRTDLDREPRAGEGRWTLHALRQPARTVLPADRPRPAAELQGLLFATPGDSLRPRWDQSRTSWQAVVADWEAGDEIAAGTVRHDAEGRGAITVTPPAAGVFRLVYETLDDAGQACRVSRDLLVGGHRAEVAVPLLLESAAATAAVGDTARFLVHSGLPGAAVHAQLLIGGRLVRSWFVDPDSALIAVPVTAEAHRGIRLQVSLVHDHQLLRDDRSVSVPWHEKRLDVAFASFRDKLRPGQQESFTVTVTGPEATAAAAELLAVMVDRSLDAIARPLSPEPLRLYADARQPPLPRANLAGDGAVWHAGPPSRRGSAPSAPRSDRLRPFPGTGGDYRLDARGRLLVNGIAPEVAATLAAEGIPLLQPFEVEGAEYMVQVRSAIQAPAIMSETFEKYAIDSVEDALARQAGEVMRAGRDAVGLPPPPAALDAVVPREDFAETAFFLPHVQTDGDGRAVIEFRVPESVTEWKVQVHALTRDLCAGSAEGRVRTVKELLVRPYLPRFLREGDTADLRVVVGNTGDEALEGHLRLDLQDLDTGRALLAEFGVDQAVRPFRVEPGGSATVVYPLHAPAALGAVAVRAVAVAGDLSDGEQHALPILPGRMHLQQSRFVALADSSRRELHFAAMTEDDPGREHEQLVVTVDTQLLTGVLRAVPFLVDYPYACTEQTLNRYLSSSILAAVYGRHPAVAALAEGLADRDTPAEAWDAPDPNRRLLLEETPWVRQAAGNRTERPLGRLLDPAVAADVRSRSLARLRELQDPGGGFPWFPGGRPTVHMTLYTLMALARGSEFGVEAPADLATRAWGYLRQQCLRAPDGDRDRPLGLHLSTLLNYVMSAYPDPVWQEAGFTDAERRAMLERSWTHRLEHSRMLQACLALTLHRAGRGADAQAVFTALMDGARADPDLGVFWAPEDRAWLWYHDTVEGHAFVLRTAAEVAPDDPRRAGLAQWLLLNKHLNHWKSTRATAEAVYALVHHMEASGTLGLREAVRVQVGAEDRRFVSDPADPTAGQGRLVLSGPQIDPATMHTVVVSKSTPGLAFASATWAYATTQAPAAADGDLFAVERRCFRRQLENGRWTLQPLREGDLVAVGDQLEVHLSLTARHAAEYVHLRDPRAAGCEPEAALSGHRHEGGVSYYQEVRDSGTNFFIAWLPAGQYTLRHRLRAATSGRFQVQPAVLQSMYAPEFAAHSAGDVLAIAP